jgi:hypothetical protein
MAINTFKKNGYQILREAVTKDIAIFAYNYLRIKREVLSTFINEKYISPYSEDWGLFNDEQAPGCFSHYGDIAMETLLLMVQPLIEKKIKTQLTPTYSYTRIYNKASELKKHKDRFSCEISCTMHLGGDKKWPIYLKKNKQDIPIYLNPGDLLIYKGQEIEHWRNPYLGQEYAQVFLHYNDASTVRAAENIYDTRIHIGLPTTFKKK